MSPGRGWRVEISGGYPIEPGPGVVFGTATVTIGGDGDHSEPTVPLIYEGVELESFPGELILRRRLPPKPADDGHGWELPTEYLRALQRPELYFDEWDAIIASGWELGPEGARWATWRIEPSSAEDRISEVEQAIMDKRDDGSP